MKSALYIRPINSRVTGAGTEWQIHAYARPFTSAEGRRSTAPRHLYVGQNYGEIHYNIPSVM